MKAVVVREITSLILRPSAPSQTPQSSSRHLKFTDDAATSSKPKPTTLAEKKNTQKDHAKYYAAITCNQIVLAPGDRDRDVARQLVKVYFELFKEILQRNDDGPKSVHKKGKERAGSDDDDEGGGKSRKRGKGKKSEGEERKTDGDAGFAEVEDSTSKLVSAVLTGVNRALPFVKLSLEDVE